MKTHLNLKNLKESSNSLNIITVCGAKPLAILNYYFRNIVKSSTFDDIF